MNLSPKWVNVIRQTRLVALKIERSCPEKCAFLPFLVVSQPSRYHSFNFLIQYGRIGIYLNLSKYNKPNVIFQFLTV